MGNKKDLPEIVRMLTNEHSAIRYWAATGLLIQAENARPYLSHLTQALKDPSPDVIIVAAEALYKMGEKEVAEKALNTALKHPDIFVRTHALNAVDILGIENDPVKKALIEMVKTYPTGEDLPMRYDYRMVQWLYEKWGMN
jgi:HEAT repeat protein